MGEVYRARDTKLNRDVALKVLPASFATDIERLARFKREAQLLAALNHPNIGAIYGFEDSDGVQALVLELVEGPTLADRIAEGPVPLDEAVPIAKQIAEALEAAHEQGIVHRDLKPANIKLRPDGSVKVLDFGLAKALAPNAGVASAGGLTLSPTITSPAMTQVGVILGTAAYMAPEQAKGREADKRSDVWAFGAVVFEMLTGRRAFDGEDMTDVLGAVVRLEPNWASLSADVPPAVRTLIQRCLVKDRRLRVSDISAARFVLNELGNIDAPAGTAVRVRSGWRRILPAAMAAALTAIIVGASAWVLRPVPGRPLVAQFSFPLPTGQSFSGTSRHVVAISPDGRNVAYVANLRIYLRSIGELQPREIPGTEAKGGVSISNPMFAPDGESIAFIEIAGTPSVTLKRVSLSGGPVSTIASLHPVFSSPGASTWGPAGILIASRRSGGGVFRVSPNGGVPERLIGLGEGEEAHGPQMLPDGHTILFTLARNPGDDDRDDGRWDKASIVAQSLTDNARRVLIEGGSDARYLPSGHLLYAVGGTMFAVPFDPARLTLTGAAVPVIVGVSRATFMTGAAQVTVSDTGTLAYLPGFATTAAAMFRLVLGDSRGDPVPLAMPPAAYVHPRVSPDGRVVAVGRNEGQTTDIWTYELSGTSEIRKLTFGGHNRFPVWSADSRRVTFQSEREGDRAIFWHAADGTGLTERLTKPGDGEEHIPEAWSRDGNRLLFSVAKGSRFSLWLLTLDGKKIERFGRVESSTVPFSANFSPDGRWVVYTLEDRSALGGSSQEPSGPRPRPNRGIFVEPFPPTGEKHLVPRMTNDYHPLWAPDGKRIFYVPNASRPVVAVPVTTSPTIAFGSPIEPSRSPRPDLAAPEMRGYDYLADGRFISLSRAFGEGTSTPLSGEVRVVINWFEELKRRVPTK